MLLKIRSVFVEFVRHEVEQVTKTLNAEFDVERMHHQKMLKDHSRLQQRLENLQNSVNLQLPISSIGTHVSRSPSNVSNLSTESESTSDKTEQVSVNLILKTVRTQQVGVNLFCCCYRCSNVVTLITLFTCMLCLHSSWLNGLLLNGDTVVYH